MMELAKPDPESRDEHFDPGTWFNQHSIYGALQESPYQTRRAPNQICRNARIAPL